MTVCVVQLLYVCGTAVVMFAYSSSLHAHSVLSMGWHFGNGICLNLILFYKKFTEEGEIISDASAKMPNLSLF